MVTSNVRITFGNSAKEQSFPSFSTSRLMAYSKTAETKLKAIGNGSSNGSDHSDASGLDTIVFATCEGIIPIPFGMHTVLLWIDMREHPANGFPAKYQGHKRLTVEIAETLTHVPIPFAGLLRIHEALLLLEPKNHLSRQWDIRKAIMDHMKATTLTPDELYKIGRIFSHETTADDKLIDYAVNMTMDFMDLGIARQTVSATDEQALNQVINAVPVLKEKMTKACEGKAARLEREKAKAARTAAFLAKRAQDAAARNHAATTKRVQGAAQRADRLKKEKLLKQLDEADAGTRPISEELVKILMGHPDF
jgi:hypothetical protein